MVTGRRHSPPSPAHFVTKVHTKAQSVLYNTPSGKQFKIPEIVMTLHKLCAYSIETTFRGLASG